MATVTGLTAARMLAIEAESVVDGDIIGDNLILTKHDGSQVNAGSVRGPQGIPGPAGTDLAVSNAVPVLDIGIINQIRAGRQLTPVDFTNMGLSAPIGLWNLSDLSDVSGNGRNLLNKGVVPFGVGINGGAATAAQFVGSTAQALYISDTGVADPFRIKTGSWGCWFKTAKRLTQQIPMAKWPAANGQDSWILQINASDNALAGISLDGTISFVATGTSDLCDDNWHFVVATYDGTALMIYVDGVLEAMTNVNGTIFAGTAPLNIGGFSADAGNVSISPFYGRIDEAFVTSDILLEENVRNLYCARIAHALGAIPSRSSLRIRRRRKGATFAVADFSTQPLRLHNFTAGSLADEGSNNVPLTNPGGTLSVAGADGSAANAMNFNGSQSLPSSDAGLPSALASRSYGCWFKSVMTGAATMMGFGGTALGTGDMRLGVSAGLIFFTSGADAPTGPFVCDGKWHLAVVTEDNAAADGVKRKLYIDGKLVLTSTVMNGVTLAGANGVRIGTSTFGAQVYSGQLDAAFICGYVIPAEDILKMYSKGSQALAPSPKNAGDHIEAFSATDLLVLFDTLETQHTIDIGVAA